MSSNGQLKKKTVSEICSQGGMNYARVEVEKSISIAVLSNPILLRLMSKNFSCNRNP